jgi:hypothetical protein
MLIQTDALINAHKNGDRMDKRLALIVVGSIIGLMILCFTVIFPFIHKQLHPSTSLSTSGLDPTEVKQPIVEKQAAETVPIESTSEKPQRAIPTYILDNGQKIRGTSDK